MLTHREVVLSYLRAHARQESPHLFSCGKYRIEVGAVRLNIFWYESRSGSNPFQMQREANFNLSQIDIASKGSLENWLRWSCDAGRVQEKIDLFGVGMQNELFA
jgi:hypothetical protein